MEAEVPALKVLRNSAVVNPSGSWFHSLIFGGENNISYLYLYSQPPPMGMGKDNDFSILKPWYKPGPVGNQLMVATLLLAPLYKV